MKKVVSLIISICLVVGLIGGCSKNNIDKEDLLFKGSNEKKLAKNRKDEIIVSAKSISGIFSPYGVNTVGDEYVSNLIYEGLFTNDSNGKIVNDICDSYSVSDDKKTYTFSIKKDVKFSNGIDLKSNDVAYTYKILADPNFNGNIPREISDIKGFSDYKNNKSNLIEGIKVLDDYNLEVTFNSEWGNPLGSFNFGIIPESEFKVNKGEIIKFKKMLRNPIGTGPYVLESWDESNKIATLKRNENYYKEKAKIKMIKIIESNEEDSINSILNGTIDLTIVTPKEEIINKAKESGFINGTLINNNSYSYIGINTNNGVLKSKNIRKALSYALDRKAILKEYYMGFGSLITMPFSIDSWEYDNDEEESYNLEKAKDILGEEGWHINNENILEKEGNKLKLRLVLLKSSYFSEKIYEVLKDSYGKLGIEIVPEFYDINDLLDKVFNEKDFDLYALNWQLPLNSNPIDIFNNKELNSVSWNNEDALEILRECDKESSYEGKKALYKEWSRIFRDDVPYILLVQPKDLVLINSQIINKRFSGLTSWVYNVEEWEIKN